MEGIYLFLYQCPVSTFFAVLAFLVIGILFIIRHWREGLPYNISVASQQGDFVLIWAFASHVEILQRQTVFASWMNDLGFQWYCFLAAVAFGLLYEFVVILKWGINNATLADTYHNLFVAPLLLYGAFITMPILVEYGTHYELAQTFFSGMIWLLTIISDSNDGRLQQPQWLAKYGIRLPLAQQKHCSKTAKILLNEDKLFG